MIKVLWFSNTAATGIEYLAKDLKVKGTGGWMNSLNNALKSEVDLTVAFHYPYKKNKFEYKNTKYYPIYNGNIYLQLIKKRFSIINTDYKYLKCYLSIIKEVQPDIIHIHGTENNFLTILKHINIPVLVSIQGNLTVYNHKYFSGFNGRFLRKIKFESLNDFILGFKSFKKDKQLFVKRAKFEERHMKNIQHVIGRTGWDFRITRVLSPNSIYYHGDEILREAFYKYKWSNTYKSGKVIVFTTNGDSYYKGIETVFHSISLLKNLGIEIDWRIAGINQNSLIKSISESYLNQNFPTSGFTLLGSLNEDELSEELLRAHLYVMPSHIENSPNNLCEAMILGLPCIAAFAGGTGSILEDGVDGILIQDGDPWCLSGAILELINNPEKSNFFSKNARVKALIRHNKERVTEQYIKTYKSILN